VQEGFEPLPHRHQGLVIAQRSPPLPQEACAAQLGPDRLQQGTTELRRLIYHKRQPHHHGTHHREMLRAMPVMGLDVVAVVFQGVERVVCKRPPRPSTPHEVLDVPWAHAHVRHPANVLDLGRATRPRLAAIAPHVWVRGLAWQVMHPAAALDHPGGAVVPRIAGHAPGGVGRRHRLAPQGLLAVCDPKHRAKPVGLPRLEVGRMGTQTVCGPDTLEVRVVLTPRGHDAFGRVACTSMFVRAILWDHGFWHHGHHGTLVRMEERGAHHLLRLRDRAVAVDLVQT
jgi:hypothetical protein